MATLYITEFARQARDAAGHGMIIPEEPPLTNQVVTVGATSAASAAFNASTTLIRVHTDVVCSVELGTAPTADAAATRRMAANTTEYFGVPQGKSYKIACITNT